MLDKSRMKDMQRQTGYSRDAVRSPEDYYITPPIATIELLKRERFEGVGWEPASGNGAIAKFFKDMTASDIRTDDDVYGEKGIDFLKEYREVDYIVTNPPFKLALSFMWHSMECARKKVALFARLLLLESKSRLEFFRKYPPIRIWVFSDRLSCIRPENKTTDTPTGIMCFAWFIWEKGFDGKPILDWILTDATPPKINFTVTTQPATTKSTCNYSGNCSYKNSEGNCTYTHDCKEKRK